MLQYRHKSGRTSTAYLRRQNDLPLECGWQILPEDVPSTCLLREIFLRYFHVLRWPATVHGTVDLQLGNSFAGVNPMETCGLMRDDNRNGLVFDDTLQNQVEGSGV